MSTVSLGSLSEKGLEKALEVCDKQISKFKNDPDRVEKYKRYKKEIEKTQEKLSKVKEKTKKIEYEDGSNFHKKWVEGKETCVSLCYLKEKINKEKNKFTKDSPTIKDSEFDAPEIDIKYDCFDKMKALGKQILEGRGFSKFLVGGCVGLGLAEALSWGTSAILTKKAIMTGATGLFGLAKFGISKLFAACEVQDLAGFMGFIGEQITSWAGVTALGVGVGAGLLALTTIPIVTKLVKKIKGKAKDNRALEEGIARIAKDDEAACEALKS